MAEIKGTDSNDKLIGTSGDDLLDGGLGRDELEGGSGADKYIFSSLSDSLDTGAGVNGDTIIGFNRDEGDKIDLSKIDARLDIIVVNPEIVIDPPVSLNDTFNVNQLSYSNGVLHADVINGPDVEIALAGAPSLNILTDIIL